MNNSDTHKTEATIGPLQVLYRMRQAADVALRYKEGCLRRRGRVKEARETAAQRKEMIREWNFWGRLAPTLNMKGMTGDILGVIRRAVGLRSDDENSITLEYDRREESLERIREILAFREITLRSLCDEMLTYLTAHETEVTDKGVPVFKEQLASLKEKLLSLGKEPVVSNVQGMGECNPKWRKKREEASGSIEGTLHIKEKV